MIEFENIGKKYDDQNALKNLTLTINDGELFVLVGPSGSGKTTLLKTINQLVVPTSGTVKVDGEDVAKTDLRQLRRHIGYVLQTGALFPNLTVAQNAAVQLDALGWDKKAKEDRISALMAKVGLPPKTFLQRMPSELSGGEAQRVGIVRALAAKPKLILMDEPFSALDPVSRRQLQQIMIELHREIDATIVFVTHDMHEATLLADRVGVVYHGALQQVGPPNEVMANPANEVVRQFFDAESSGDRLLKQVLVAGLGREKQPGETPLKVRNSQTVFEWAGMLKRRADQLIEVDGRVLTIHDLLNYVARLGEESDHDQ